MVHMLRDVHLEYLAAGCYGLFSLHKLFFHSLLPYSVILACSRTPSESERSCFSSSPPSCFLRCPVRHQWVWVEICRCRNDSVDVLFQFPCVAVGLLCSLICVAAMLVCPWEALIFFLHSSIASLIV
ncbi:uncharacterized protein LOC129286390 [Prosopis cineraria]|uniref:uncharacterized protein LOC129286390 n=1 Tax=Prosopis cineraria TaxID=364024 RepID=UPI00240EC2FA|nr:uncharacterized protein LOC129286390 [Prosopis cineraria]